MPGSSNLPRTCFSDRQSHSALPSVPDWILPAQCRPQRGPPGSHSCSLSKNRLATDSQSALLKAKRTALLSRTGLSQLAQPVPSVTARVCRKVSSQRAFLPRDLCSSSCPCTSRWSLGLGSRGLFFKGTSLTVPRHTGLPVSHLLTPRWLPPSSRLLSTRLHRPPPGCSSSRLPWGPGPARAGTARHGCRPRGTEGGITFSPNTQEAETKGPHVPGHDAFHH